MYSGVVDGGADGGDDVVASRGCLAGNCGIAGCGGIAGCCGIAKSSGGGIAVVTEGGDRDGRDGSVSGSGGGEHQVGERMFPSPSLSN